MERILKNRKSETIRKIENEINAYVNGLKEQWHTDLISAEVGEIETKPCDVTVVHFTVWSQSAYYGSNVLSRLMQGIAMNSVWSEEIHIDCIDYKEEVVEIITDDISIYRASTEIR